MQKGCKPKLIVKLYLELVFNMQLQNLWGHANFLLPPLKQNRLPGMKIVSDQVGKDDAILDCVVESLHVRVIDEFVIPVPEHTGQGVTCNMRR